MSNSNGQPRNSNQPVAGVSISPEPHARCRKSNAHPPVMTLTVAVPPNQGSCAEPALYPPTVRPPSQPLPLLRFLGTFVRNPLSSLSQSVYEQPIVVHDNGRGQVAWVTAPALTEKVLLHSSAQFPKTPLERRVFQHTLGEGILTSEGASWRW